MSKCSDCGWYTFGGKEYGCFGGNAFCGWWMDTVGVGASAAHCGGFITKDGYKRRYEGKYTPKRTWRRISKKEQGKD